MALKAKLLEDMKQAMKDRDTVRKNTVQLVRASVLQVEKDKQITLDDDGVLDIIAKELKSRKNSLVEYEKSNRQDLIDTLKKEIEILIEYLPEQLSDDELDKIVKDFVDKEGFTSMKDIGKVMSGILPLVKGRADGKQVNISAKKFLN